MIGEMVDKILNSQSWVLLRIEGGKFRRQKKRFSGQKYNYDSPRLTAGLKPALDPVLWEQVKPRK